jgi:hemolysin D
LLRAPISGTVQALSVTTAGQVVNASEEVMRIVPHDTPHEIEAYIANKDIGFVNVGQNAIVKIEAFPFTRYGTIDATISHVSKDALPEAEANATESAAAYTAKTAAQAGSQRVQNLVFPVTLVPQQQTLSIEKKDIPLSAGMAVTIEIRTGRRRLLDYLFTPVATLFSESLRER